MAATLAMGSSAQRFQQLFRWGSRQLSTWIALSFALGLFPVLAHNLDSRATGIFLDTQQLATMGTRAGMGQQLIQPGDRFWVIMKTTPGPGTDTGVGGYQTFYVPPGVRIHAAAYVRPVPTTVDPRGFIEIAMKGQSPIAIGDGPIGAKTTPDLIGLTLPGVNGLGLNSAPVDAAGKHRGTIAGLYADTGIFYSTDPRTAFYTYQTPPAGVQPTLINNSGDVVGEYDSVRVTDAGNVLGVTTLWDAYQLLGYGNRAGPIIDSVDQRGNAPWGLANVVAGPQSGYAWEFDYAAYLATGGTKLQRVQAAMKIGPWNRIQYPGSQISKDQPGLISTVIGYTGIDASTMGYDLNAPANYIERQADGTGVNAIRFAIGQLQLARPEFSAVQVEIVDPIAADNCYRMYSDAVGGDAGANDNGKDHIWRYFDPSVVGLNPCVLLQKVDSKPIVAPGEVYSYQIVFANNGNVAIPNVILTDTFPSGITYVSAVPAPTTIAPPKLVWNIGTVPPNTIISITVYVKATGTGTLCNKVSAVSGTGEIGMVEECTESGLIPLLIKKKTVAPSNVSPGETVTYTITVDNVGSATGGAPLLLTDYLPAGFTYQSIVSATVNGAAVIPTVGGTATQPTFSVSPGIQVGKQLVLKFNALVGVNVPPGNYCNGVEMQLPNGIRDGPVPEACVTVGGGHIGDTIFRDWNGNGLQDSTDEGLSGVTVTLNGPNCGPCLTTTDATGFYLFAGLQPGAYTVTVPAPGSGGVPAGYLLTADPDGAPATTTFNKNLAFNEGYLLADFGYQPRGSGSIGDLIFNDQNGDGLFNGGDVGIPGVTVALYEDSDGNGMYDAGTDALVASTTTDGAGGYIFSNLPLGFDYLVYVDATDAGLDAYFVNAFVATTPNPHPVDNLAGAYTAADIGWLENSPSSIGDTVFEDENGNGLYDLGTDIPLNDVQVTLYRDSNHDGVPDGQALLSMESDPNGQYLFSSLPPDGYLVIVDSSDPDLPPNLSAKVSQYVINLPAATQFLTADFPFTPLLDKTVDLASAIPGQTLTYTIVPNYPGPGLLTDAQVIDPVPLGTSYVDLSANASGYTNGVAPPGTVVTWDLGSNSPDQPGTTPASGTVNCPGTLILNPDADTFINEDKKNENKGSEASFLTRNETKKRKVGLLHFSLASLPANAVIQSASLKLPMAANYGGKKQYVEVRELLTPFGETTATWNDSDGGGAGDWASNGIFGTNDFGVTAYGGAFKVPAKAATPSFTITALVNKWRTAGAGANWGAGMILLPTGASEGNDATWRSRTGTPAPQLVIQYVINQNVACSGVSTLSAAADTYVKEDSDGNDNYGATKTFITKTENKKSKVALIRFDTTGIPSGATIDSVTLNLTVTGAQNSHTDSIYELLTPWTESGATWKKKDGTANWAGGAAGFSSSDYNAAALATIDANTTGLKSASSPALKTLLEAILAGTKQNLGLALITTAGSKEKEDAIYASRENSTTASRPTLTVAWTLTPAVSTESRVDLHVNDRLVGGTTNVIELEMLVSSPSSTLTAVTPPTDLILNPGAAMLTKVSGPIPAGPTNLLANQVARFVYRYGVTPGGSPTSVSFQGMPTATGVNFNLATSEGVIVTPPLTFQVLVGATPPTVVENIAELIDTGVGLDVTDDAVTAIGPSIGDFVWADFDGQGDQDPSEPGIANVRVYLDADSNGVLDWIDTDADGAWDSGEGEQWTKTDATGHYLLTGLTVQSYNVRYDLTTVPLGFVPSTPLLHTTPVLGAAQQYLLADFGLVPHPGELDDSTIGDTLWVDTNENGVVDVGEMPVANVTINLYGDINNNGVVDAGEPLLRTTSTDANGHYLFTGLGQGHFVVDADEADPDFPGGLQLVTGGSPVTTAPANGVQDVDISAPSTAVTTADFGYNYSGQIGDFVWYDTNGNGLQDEVPLQGARRATLVLVIDLNSNGIVDPNELAIRTYETGSTGYYLFDNLPPGEYIVQMSEQEVPSPVSGLIGTMVQTTGGDQAVTLSPGNMVRLDVDFGVQEAASLAGHVFHDVNHTGVLDAGDIVIANVTVNLYGPGPDGFLGTGDDVLVQTQVTNAGGEYLFLVSPGDYRIEYVTSDPDFPLSIRAPNGEATTSLSYSVAAQAGMEYTGFDFGRDDTGRIGDTIFADLDGTSGAGVGPGAGDTGLDGVTVNLYLDTNGDGTIDADGADNLPGTADDEPLMDTRATGATGFYEFVGLADTAGAAQYLVQVNTATLPGTYQPTPTSYPTGAIPATSTYSTTLVGASAINIVDFGYPLIAGPTYYTVSGTIYDDNGNGGGTIGNGTQNGTEPGLLGVTVTIEIDTDNNGSYDLVYVRVTDVNGDYSQSGIPAGSDVRITVDPTTLPNSAYVQTGDPNGVPLSNVWTIPTIAANHPNLDFGYLAQYGRIAGTVVEGVNGNGLADVGEVPIAGVAIALRYAGADGILNTADDTTATVNTDAAGNYSFDATTIVGGPLDNGLLPGIYQITETNLPHYFSLADADGGNPDNISVTLGMGENRVDQDFEDFEYLKLGNRIWADTDNSGTINNAEPGIGNVTVQLFLSDGGGNPTGLPLATLITDPNGYYRFDGLVPGTYVVVVPTVNFGSGQPLDGLLSSGSGLGTFNGVDPDLDPTDSDDNGNNPFNPLVSGVRSAAVTLAYDTEPGGTDLGPGDLNSNDTNLTVDFGFTLPVPTAIRLVYLKGWSVNGRVTVEWETVSELNTVGFRLYRMGTDESWVPVGGLVPAIHGVGGGVYRVFDADLPIPSRQRYVLLELETTGKENRYGPFEVNVQLGAVETGIRVNRGNIEICFGGQPDVEYVVESTDDLNEGRWVSLGRVRADAAGLAVFREALTESKKFYRALQP